MFRLARYFLFGLVVLASVGWAQYRGWSPMRTREVRDVPRSVRDNPGAYRSPYIGGIGRYPRGK